MRTNFKTDPGEMDTSHRQGKLVLGLDLGTNCGYTYAFVRTGTLTESGRGIIPAHMGQWDLSAGPYDSGAIRFLRLRHFLSATRPDVLFYEEVRVQPAGLTKVNAAAVLSRVATAAEFIGALRATAATWCEEHGVPCTGFSIGTVKKRATGRGNCGKEDVIRACNNLFGTAFETEGYETTGVDNIADSAFVCLLGLEQYGSGLLPTTED